jgi:hypothetical protein
MIAKSASATWLTEILFPLMRYRITNLGDDASGAFGVYRDRIRSERVFSESEIQLMEAIIASGPPVNDIHQIGCGWGEFIFLLAWNEYRAVGFEDNNRRFAGAEDFRRILYLLDRDRASRAAILNQSFPPRRWPDAERGLVIATNVEGDDAAGREDEIIGALPYYRYAIIDTVRFCRHRNPSERDALLSKIEESGLRNLGLFCDVDEDAQFYLFETKVTKN